MLTVCCKWKYFDVIEKPSLHSENAHFAEVVDCLANGLGLALISPEEETHLGADYFSIFFLRVKLIYS